MGDCQRRSYAEALGMRKEPEGDKAFVKGGSNNALNFFLGFEVDGDHEARSADCLDARMAEVLFYKPTFFFHIIQELFILYHLQCRQGGRTRNGIPPECRDVTQHGIMGEG